MNFIKTIITFLLLISSLSFSQVNTERFRKDSSEPGLSANIDFDVNIITGNTDLKFISLGGRLNYDWQSNYTFLISDFGYGWSDDKKIFDQALLHLRNVLTISDLVQQETFIQFDFNKKRLLNSRELIGAGLRFKIYKSDEFKFRTGLAYIYEIEEYKLPENSIHGKLKNTHRLSSYVTFEINLKEGVRLLSIEYFQPDIVEFADYKFISENVLIVDLGKYLDLNIKFNLRYDSRPPDTIKSLDTITKFGLTVKL